MNYREERERAIAHLIPHLPYMVIDRLFRSATTLHRLAEAQCNGDWPYDNGQRPTVPCGVCEAGTVPSQLKTAKRACPDCMTQARVVKLLAPYPNVKPTFQGDPRGCELSLEIDGRTYGIPGRY